MLPENKIKIIHLVSDLGIGGVQKVVLDICSSADLTKYDISIFTLNPPLDLLATYNLPPEIKIKTFTYNYSDNYSLLSYFKHIFFTRTVRKKSEHIVDSVLNEKPDILHVHIHPREMNIGILVAEKIKCRLIYTQHLMIFTSRSLAFRILGVIFRYTFRKYHLIAVSQRVFEEIKSHKLLGKNKLFFLIENKLNLKIFQPKTKKAEVFTSVVYIARIGPPKAHAELIQAWSKLNHEPTKKRLLLVGPDGSNNEIHQLAKKLVPDESVIFMGSRYNIADILSECDFAVFPSFKEGLPIALLEKMAMELPVIVSDIPELTNVIEDNVNGLVFKCGNVDDLAEKITILLQNPDLRIQLGKKARETVKKRFGTENTALANEKAYEEIMKCG
jgi:glycosyltransferase involved in cell wall biosynthesis